MSISVNQNHLQNVSVGFKGRWEKTNNAAPYYKTNEGSVIGGIMAIPAFFSWIHNVNKKDLNQKQIDAFKTLAEKAASPNDTFDKYYAKSFLEGQGYNGNLEEFVQSLNKYRSRMKKCAIPFALLAGGMTFGCGYLVDYLRNQKAQEVANNVKEKGAKATLNSYENAVLSENNHVYYKSNIGSKWGAVLGTTCGIVASAMEYRKGTKISNNLTTILGFALGGWLLGKLADRNTNKSTSRNV